MVGLGIERRFISGASLAQAAIPEACAGTPMLFAEVQAAAHLSTEGLTAANIRQAAINFLGTFGVITKRRDTVPDVTMPFYVVADFPTHWGDLYYRLRMYSKVALILPSISNQSSGD